MLVGPDQYEEVYLGLREELHASEQKKVLVFVATDSCDSVCAVKTLQVMLKHCRYTTVFDPKLGCSKAHHNCCCSQFSCDIAYILRSTQFHGI